jgi:hypothetical protein
MNKILYSLFLAAAFVATSFATGTQPNNGVQSGTLTYVVGQSLSQTGAFPIPYTSQPIVFFNPTSTNNSPFTNVFVTLTNFCYEAAPNTVSGTNATVNWTSMLGYTRIQTGTNAVSAGSWSNSFPVPYALPPVVTITTLSSLTVTNNSYSVLTNVTATGFYILSVAAENISWSAIGTAYYPGATTVTY